MAEAHTFLHRRSDTRAYGLIANRVQLYDDTALRAERMVAAGMYLTLHAFMFIYI
tara:strand:+ start:356 stop:520 length:165 start_codon:yes stop_codon:yes gene_type:complete